MKRTVKFSLLACLILLASVFVFTACKERPEYLPKFHIEVVDRAVDPTCNEPGLTAGRHCSACGEVFEAQEIIPPTGHNSVIDNGIAPTCTEKGLTDGIHCSVCGEILKAQEILPASHTVVVDTAVAPTCTSVGLTEGKHCSVCNEVLVAQIETPKINHSYDDKYDEDCNECGFIRDAECAHTNVYTQPAKNATCTEPGLTEGKICAKCEEIIVAQTVIDVLGHTEVIDEAVAPTCINSGLTAGKHCSACNEIFVAQTVVAALGHTEVIDEAVAPTCTKTGLTEGKHCSVCNNVLVSQTVVAVLGHILSDNVCTLCGERFTDGVLIYSLAGDANSYIVSAIEGCMETEIVIPAFYNGLPITSIGSNAFYNCSSLVNIVIPYTVTSIGSYAFSGCTSLKRINSDTDGELILPEELTTIGSYAFQNLTQITEIVVPDSVTSIGSAAFSGCSAIKSMTLPFVGGSVKTASSSYQYPFGYIFGTSSYTGGVATTQSYYYSSSSATSNTYYIPESLKNVTITGGNILYGAFYNMQYVESITITSDVTSIGNYAFYNCYSLEAIELPESLTSIGSYAFYGCISLEAIELPESLTSIGSYAFQNCTSITAIELPETLTSIGSYAFYGCTGIKKINSDTDGELILHEGLKTIGSYAFQNLTQITEIVVPDSVTSIGQYAFYGCSAVESITVPFVGNNADSTSTFSYIFYSVPSSLKNITITTDTTIPGSAFEGLQYVESITLSSDVTSIGSSAFYNCYSLEEIELPESLESIGNYAFYNCYSLEAIELPESLTSIGSYVFSGCTGIKRINSDTDGELVLPEGFVTIGESAFSGLTQITSVVIPDTVTTIGQSAFYGCTGIKRINSDTDGELILLEGLKTIGSNAFYGLTQITEIVVPDSVTKINNYAFSGCSALESITVPFVGDNADSSTYFYYLFDTSYSYVPNTLKNIVITTDTTIPYRTFYNLQYVESITIPSNVKGIGNEVFRGCTSLKRLNSTTDGLFNIPEGITIIGNSTFYNCDAMVKVVIPAGVTSIDSYAFYSCSSLEEVEFATGCELETIGSNAFQNCTSLAEIQLPESVTIIGEYAFSGCTALKRLNSETDGEMILHEGLERIGSYAFQNLTQITEIVVPDSVTSIYSYAFYGCSALESITLPFVGDSVNSTSTFSYIFYSVPSSLKNITITTATTIPYQAFYGLKYIESIKIPCTVTSIGNSAFYGCTGLKRINSDTDGELILFEGLETIGSGAFQNLTQITKIVVPDSVTSIGLGAFNGCSSLEDITLPFVGKTATSSANYEAVFGYIFGRYTSSTSSKPSGTTYQGWGMYNSYDTSGEYGRNSYYSSSYYADYYYIPTSIKSVTITVDTTIPYGAFHNCSFIETITLPNNVTSEGTYAYRNCSATVSKTYVPKLSIWDGSSVSTSFSGEGTEEAPYQINSAADLAYLRNTVNNGESYEGKYFVLNVDINLNSSTWTPIGTSSNPFAGTFDGNGKKISNLYVYTSSTHVGLFGYVSGTVKNLGITSGAVTYSSTPSTVYAGGLVGYLSGTVENCYSCATVNVRATSSTYAGGLVGYVTTDATVSNSYATGNVTGYTSSNGFAYAGGIVGYNKGTIEGSLAFGNVTATGQSDAQSRNGGLAGRNDSGTITDCYRSEDQELTKYYSTGNAYCNDGTEASYSDMIAYAEENWDLDVWSFSLKYPTHK